MVIRFLLAVWRLVWPRPGPPIVLVVLLLAGCVQGTSCGAPPDCGDAGAHQVMPGPSAGNCER